MLKRLLGYILLLLAIEASAGVPLLVQYQGRYAENGVNYNGARNIRFYLYSVPSAGTILWDSGVQVLNLQNGYYSYLLGSGVALGQQIFTNSNLYLQVEIQGSTLTPRERILSVGYSFNSQKLDGYSPAQSGSNYIVFADKNGNVGIGTNAPQSRFHLKRGALASDTNTMIMKSVEQALVPKGLIVLWSGTLATIPTGWALCDGLSGTPDLRDRFVMGVQSAENPGLIGGTNSLSLTIGQLAIHNHPYTTSSDGGHTGHGGGGDIFDAYAGGYQPDSGLKGLHQHSYTTAPAGMATVTPYDKRPSFYKLAFIMKL